MKHLCIGIFIYMSMSISAQDMKISPEKPEAGETITITYNPSDGPLKNMDAHAIVYSFVTGSEPIAYEVFMSKTQGKFKIPSDSEALFVKFSNADESVIDKNNEKGYPVLLYNDDRIIQGSNSAIASAYLSYPRYISIEQSTDLGKEYLNDEFDLYPNQKSDQDCFNLYAKIGGVTDDDNIKAEIRNKISEIQGEAKSDEANYEFAISLAQSIRDREIAQELDKELVSKYPKNKSAINKKVNAFRKIEDLDEKLAFYNDMEKELGDEKASKDFRNSMVRGLAHSYGELGDRENFYKYAKMLDNPTTVASLCNSLAWGFTGESLEGEPKHLEFGEELSRWSLETIEKEKTAKSKKPGYFTDTRWKSNMDYSYAMYADTYALLAHKLGDKENALKYQTIAVKQNDFGDGDMNTRYAIFKEAMDGGLAVMPFLEKMIQEGNASLKMREQYIRLYKQNMTIDDAAEKYVLLLEEKAKEKHREEIKKEIIEEEGKPFSLVNLDGETVSLDGLKGKILILDFWATWCGPCKASFPGMQMAVDKYADDPNVEFLFVDTWENGDNKEEIVRSFIEKNEYRFNVLMDNKNEVVANYGVRGIPTKFVLDQEGSIRYKSVGFSGNDAELVDELTIVIDILKAESSDVVQP